MFDAGTCEEVLLCSGGSGWRVDIIVAVESLKSQIKEEILYSVVHDGIASHPIVLGMIATVDIGTDEKTIFDYLV